MPRPIYLLPALGLALLLAACGATPPDDLNARIESGDAAGALTEITTQLASDPTNPTLHFLAAKARLVRCAELNCPASAPDEWQALEKNLQAAGPTATLPGGTTLHVADELANLAPRYAALPGQPAPLAALVKLAPANAQAPLTEALFGAALKNLRLGVPTAAIAQLNTVAALPGLSRTLGAYANWLAASLKGEAALAESHQIALRSAPEQALPPAALRLIPHVLAARGVGTSAGRLAALPEVLQSWQLNKLFTPSARAQVAAELNTLRTNAIWQARLLPAGAAPQTTLSSTTPLTTSGGELALTLARVSLQLAPGQPQLWAEFLPAATAAVQAGAPLGVLAGPSPAGLSSELQGDYVQRILALVDARAAAGQPILPLLKSLGTLQLNRPTQTQLEKLVQAALGRALAQKNLAVALDYASFRPSVAAPQQGALAGLVKAALTSLTTAPLTSTTLAHLRTLDERVQSLNLPGLAMPVLVGEAFLTAAGTPGVSPLWAADAPDVLQTDATSAHTPVADKLGQWWAYLSQHPGLSAAARDELLDNIVAGATGRYGMATALYRLNPWYSPDADGKRAAYLAATIQEALAGDRTLTPAERLASAAALTARHPGLVLEPLVEQALDAATGLDDSQRLWQAATPPLRNTIRTLRPQFAALMDGIAAVQTGQLLPAVNAFSKVNAPAYAEALAPFLATVRGQLAARVGLYAATLPSGQTATVQVLHSLINPGAPTGFSLVFTNRLGSLSVPDTRTLGTNHAALVQARVVATADNSGHTLSISAQARAAAGGSPPFDDVFGAITALTLKPATDAREAALTLTLADGTSEVFQRLAVNPTAPAAGLNLLPGRYAFTLPSPPNPPADLQAILPPGSLLTLRATTPSDTLPPEHAGATLVGQLFHPAAKGPLPVVGSFNPQVMTATLHTSYPLPSGGMVKAILTCQPLAGPVLCAAHPAHQPREAGRLIMRGSRTREDLTTWQTTLSGWNTSQTEALLANTPLPAFTVPALPAPSPTTNSPTLTSPTESTSPTNAPNAGQTSSSAVNTGGELLPPPALDEPSPTRP